MPEIVTSTLVVAPEGIAPEGRCFRSNVAKKLKRFVSMAVYGEINLISIRSPSPK
jgi:hypothetical protein